MDNIIVRIRFTSGVVDSFIIVDGRLAGDRESEPLTLKDLVEIGAFIDAHLVDVLGETYRICTYNVMINSKNIERLTLLTKCIREMRLD